MLYLRWLGRLSHVVPEVTRPTQPCFTWGDSARSISTRRQAMLSHVRATDRWWVCRNLETRKKVTEIKYTAKSCYTCSFLYKTKHIIVNFKWFFFQICNWNHTFSSWQGRIGSWITTYGLKLLYILYSLLKQEGPKGPRSLTWSKRQGSRWSHLQRTTNVVHQILVEDL